MFGKEHLFTKRDSVKHFILELATRLPDGQGEQALLIFELAKKTSSAYSLFLGSS